jgi:Flp pilus assembly protein TadD
MIERSWLLVIVLVVGLGAVDNRALAQSERKACIDGSGNAAIESCRRALAVSPRDRSLSLALAEHLSQAGRDEEALEVLRSALEHRPKDDALLNKLAIVESNLDEKKWVENRGQDQKGKTKVSVTQKLNRIRCEKRTGQSALKACDELLITLPEEANIHARRGFILMDLGRSEEALSALETAAGLGSPDPRVQAGLKDLKQQHGGGKQLVAEKLIFDPVQGTYRLQ